MQITIEDDNGIVLQANLSENATNADMCRLLWGTSIEKRFFLNIMTIILYSLIDAKRYVYLHSEYLMQNFGIHHSRSGKEVIYNEADI